MTYGFLGGCRRLRSGAEKSRDIAENARLIIV